MQFLRVTLFSLLTLSLAPACTTLGVSEDNLGSGGPDGGCDRTGSGAACTLDSDCPSHEECEHGTCQLHGSVCDDGGDDDDGGSGSDDGDDGGSDDPQGDECTVDTDCGSGLECEDGWCKPHGGDGEDD